jgi:hypothetical protein
MIFQYLQSISRKKVDYPGSWIYKYNHIISGEIFYYDMRCDLKNTSEFLYSCKFCY